MTDVNPERMLDYRQEAGVFLSTMDEMAPQLRLDYSVDSLQRLEQFITEHFEPPGNKTVSETLQTGIAAYLGEVIIRQMGGQWHPEGRAEIHSVGPIESVLPLDRVRLRFQKGRQESLAWYYHALVKQVYEADASGVSSGEAAPLSPSDLSEDGEPEGVFSLIRGLFGKKPSVRH